MSSDAKSWIGHAALGVFVPLLGRFSPTMPPRVMFAIVGVAVAVAFCYRESRNRREKIRTGTWTERWKNDMVGDLVGPVTAGSCYFFAWLLG